MITIKPSQTADTRTCDFARVSKQTLLDSSRQHIQDVRLALGFFIDMLQVAADVHDADKITDIDGFHRDFVRGFAPDAQDWWTAHRRLNRHHLTMDDGIPADVNLIDVLDFIADCVMAGMARSGSVRPLDISPDVLMRAFQNTAKLLESEVTVSCGATSDTGAVCALPAGHTENHRGPFAHGIAQWPK